MKRIFIAVNIQVNISTHRIINEIINKLSGEKIKWVDISNLHITLKFIGNIEKKTTPLIAAKLSETLENKLQNSSFLLKGINIFGGIKSPRVLWMGIKNNDGLIAINNIIENELSDLGIEKSKKSFSPHLTLGRIKFVKNLQKLKEISEEYKNHEFQEIKLNEVIIYESILKPEGPIYNVLYILKL